MIRIKPYEANWLKQSSLYGRIDTTTYKPAFCTQKDNNEEDNTTLKVWKPNSSYSYAVEIAYLELYS